MTAPKVERTPLQREPTPTLQERVRIFNLGTPTPMHVGTHELVNELWRELEKCSAALEETLKAFDQRSRGGRTGGEEAVYQRTLAAITKIRGAIQ